MRGFNKFDDMVISLWEWITQCVFYGTNHDFSRFQIWFQRIYLILFYGLIVGVWIYFLEFR